MVPKPTINNPDSLQSQGYVNLTYKGQTYRFYHGKNVGLDCSPNTCKTVYERNKELERLQYHIYRLLLAGWNPVDNGNRLRTTLTTMLKEEFIHENTKNTHLSARHIADMQFHAEKFRNFLAENKLDWIRGADLNVDLVQEYLNTITSSNNYYMIVRNRLSCLFGIYEGLNLVVVNPLPLTATRRKKPKLHKAYTKEQMDIVLETMRLKHPDLHLCALMMYGCFLRPHEEIRMLKRGHFNQDLSRIALGADENKGRDIRITPVPLYVRQELETRKVGESHPQQYIFALRKGKAPNRNYFDTAWKRIKSVLLKDKIIEEDHTLYSIRHTAAIRTFEKTQNLRKLSQLMGHKDVHITMTYLRSLGVLLHIDESDMPEL